MPSPIRRTDYGTLPDGTAVELYTLENANGLSLRVITYGATITELHVPDRSGRLGDIVLGLRSLEEYEAQNSYMGCVIGRFANRIARGRFMLDGRTYAIAVNDPPNTLHGGARGFGRAVWKARAVEGPGGPSVEFRHVSPDGDEGFPGVLRVRMTCTLTNANELRIDYEAQADRTTPVNLTHHSYFNLACGGDILGHRLRINARRYTPVDATLIPTGALADVAGGPLDFTVPKPVGRDIRRASGGPGGYDHNFVLDAGSAGLALAATLHEPAGGRTMEVLTDEPGMQLFTSNHFDGSLVGKRGEPYLRHAALSLETQHFPDSVNQPGFPSTLLRPGGTFRSTTVHRFSAG